jgi:hypothetical protein
MLILNVNALVVVLNEFFSKSGVPLEVKTIATTVRTHEHRKAWISQNGER